MEKNRKSVPEFGKWDQKAGTDTNYTLVFSQARANRKQHKSDYTPHSIGNENELLKKPANEESVGRRKGMLRCFSCIFP